MNDLQRILIVDDEADFAKGLARLVSSGFPELEVSVAANGREALEAIDAKAITVMLLDLNMPGMHGLDVIAEARLKDPGIITVVLTAHGTVETAVSALKQGAWDFLTKPVRREDLLRTLAKAMEHSRLLGENTRLKQIMAHSELERSMIGDSPVMRRLRESITAVAASGYIVLIRGESGTGKELIAEAIHNLSPRRAQAFLKVNCPAIPEQLLESELFGHAKGAFTGATSAHKGMFVQAAGGTLLLDEVGDMPTNIQTKLLRTLQDGEVRPVGATGTTRIDTRIIAATNRNLEEMIKQGTFREDLFYRLNVLTIDAPPLRERREDIPLLAAHFLLQSCNENGIPPKRLTPAAVAALTQHDWPGNVRELQNFIRRAAVFSSGTEIDLGDLHLDFESAAPSGGNRQQDGTRPQKPYKDAKNQLLDAFTRSYMKELFSRTGGNVSEAARLSGLERVSLQKILRRLELDRTKLASDN